MSKNKSYMNNSSILSEGIFDKIVSFFKLGSKVSKDKKFAKKLKKLIGSDVDSLNDTVSSIEDYLNKQDPSTKPIKLHRFTWRDFIK